MKLTLAAVVSATLIASLIATANPANAATPASIRTPLAASTHGKPSVRIKPTYTLPAGSRVARSAIAVYAGKRKIAEGATVVVTPGRYTEISSVTYRVPVATTVQTAISTPTQVPVVTAVTTPGTYEALYESATCTTTSWSSLDYETNFDDNTAYVTGSSTANCTSPAFPGVVEQDFEFWGWNDHDNIPTPAPSAAFMGAVGATYTAQVLFAGDGPSTTSNVTTYVTQNITTYVASVRHSWSGPITLTARRGLLVVR